MKAKKILSFFLAFAMIFSTLNIGVFATGETSSAAMIGTTGYNTLADAIQAASAGDEIVLYKDLDSVPTINKAITIKGDANSNVRINGAIAENFPDIDGTVTFENVTFNEQISTENASNDQSKMTLKFVGCTFNIPAGNTYAIQGGASHNNDVLGGLYIDNCTFNTAATSFTKGYMIYAQCVKSVTVKGCTIDGNSVYRGAIHLGDSTEYATVATVEGNTIKNIARGVQIGNRVEGSSVTVSGNTFNNVNAVEGETESAALYIHEVANAETTDVSFDDNTAVESVEKLVFSENKTGAISNFVTSFDGNTTKATEDAEEESVTLEEVSNDTVVAGAQIKGGAFYITLAEAIKAANTMTGDVAVEIIGATEFINGMELNGKYDSITFVGKNKDAVIAINQSAGGDYLEAAGKTVKFNNLTLAKKNPAWADNSGHMGNYFSIQGGTVTYDNCVFPNGACTSTGTATYNGCTFNNTSEYGLWVYDDAIVTVNGGTIDSKKGIKVYSEEEDSVTSTLLVQNATFTENITDKPAVAIGYAEEITLIGNTYNNTTGVIELDSGSDADCNGIKFTVQDASGNDIASTLTAVDRSNSNAPCGVLVNGDIYTTVTEAAKDAKSSDKVVLLYDSAETVEFAIGVTLDKNNYEADNVKVKAPDLEIKTADELIAFAKEVNENKNEYSGKVVVLASDIDLKNEEWTPIGASGDSAPKFRGTFDGQGNTISNLYVKQGAAYHSAGLFGATNGTIKNLTIDGANVESLSSAGPNGTVNGTAVVAGSTAYGATIDNVHVKNATVKGNRYVAGIVGYMDGSVTNCSVENVTLIATPDDIDGNAEYDNGDKVGGIVGYCNSNAVEISGCELKGDVSITAYRDVAGIVGCVSEKVSVKSNTNSAALTVTVDQKTNSYGSKDANADEFIGRYTPAENTGNTTSDEASYTSVVINKVEGLSGEGTAEKPYLINNLSELIWFRDKVDEQASDGSTQFAGKYFNLTSDIDLAGINWNPIGSMTGDHCSFKGVFDGNGHTISNLYIEKASNTEQAQGLFAYTTGNAEIKNLTIENVTIDGYRRVGAVIGNAFIDTKLTNVHVTGKIDVKGDRWIGGIVGHGYVVMDNVSVKAEGTLNGSTWSVGGILGYGGEGTTDITNASVEGTGETGLVITSAAGGLGAIVGMAEDNNGTQPISGANLSAKNVDIKTYIGAYGDAYADYALGYLYGGNPTSELTGDLILDEVEIELSTGEQPSSLSDLAASINGKAYMTLESAIAAANGTDIVKLLNSAEKAIDTADKTVYIDPNGFDISKGFKSNGVTVTFDETAIAALDTQADDKGFAVKVNDITSVTEAINGSAPTRALNIDVKTSDGTAIFTETTSETNGTATVTVPYTKAKEEHTLHVYYVKEDGTATEVEAKYANGALSFDAKHFSTYAVVEGISKKYNIAAAARVNPANNDKFYNAGERIYVDFTISSEEIDTLGSFQFEFKYDSALLTLLDIESTLGNKEGALTTDKTKCRVSFDVDGDKSALSIAGGKIVATAVFEVKEEVNGETGITIDETKTLEVTPLGYDKNEAKPTVQNETVNLSNITVTFKPGDNAAFANGETEITAHVNYNVAGFVEAGFSVPADKLIANDSYRMKKDTTDEPLWVDAAGNEYTSEALKNTAFKANVTLTAQTVAICEITLVAGENGHLEGKTSFVVDAGTSLTEADIAKVTPVADPGYKFKEWTPAIDGKITGNTEIVASFDHASYTISTDSVDEAIAEVTVTGGVTGGKATHGTDVTFTVTPENDNITEVGYIVDGVKTPLEEADGSYTIPGDKIVGNVDVYVLTVDMFTVTFTAGENGEVSGTTTFTVNKSEALTAADLEMVTPVADAGYFFVGYALDGNMISEENLLKKEIYENITITALFDHDTFKLTDVNNGTVDVTHGTDYTFTPIVEGMIVTGVTGTYGNGGDVVIEKNADGSYTIPGNAIIDDITLRADTVEGSIRFILNRQYKALKGRQEDADEKIAVLDTDKLDGEKYVLESGAQFYWSEKYNAYVYIVAGLTEEEGMTAAMLAAALQTASGNAKEIVYDGDMNGDGAITVSDAMIITDILHQKRLVSTSILQRLRADIDGSKYVSTADVDTVRIAAQNQ